MRIRFWGTRGSLARPGPTTLRYGGNTACVEVESAAGTLIVLDSGTGSFELGLDLLAPHRPPVTRGHLLLTHTHWDHIQGIPFFAPLFKAGQHWDIYAPQGLGNRVADTLAGQMAYSYFPVRLDQLAATVHCHDLTEGAFQLDDVRITAQYTNHPVLTLCYRLEVDGASLAYVTDHEPHTLPAALALDSANGAWRLSHPEDRRHLDFITGADVLIHDAQYTASEYAAKAGWGHTAAEHAVDLAIAAGVRRLILFHHDPLRTDEAVDALVEVCRARARRAGSGLEVGGAAEGGSVEIGEREARPAGLQPAAGRSAIVESAQLAPATRTVLVVDDDPVLLQVTSSSLRQEGFHLVTAGDGAGALRLAREERPNLIVLDWMLPEGDGLDVCRALRAADDPVLRSVPIMLVTVRDTPEDMAEAFAAGATDFLVKPVPPARLRARARAWLMRHR